MVTRWSIGDRALFFLDEATLEGHTLDAPKSVRGGNPFLFPSPGRLTGGTYRAYDGPHPLGQHGFGRDAVWRIGDVDAPDRLALVLEDAPRWRNLYPWRFRVQLTYTLSARALRTDVEVESRGAVQGDAPMVFGVGFHPYFFVESGAKGAVRIEPAATRAWDNVEKRDRDIAQPFDFGREVDLHLRDAHEPRAALVLPDGARVELTGDPAFSQWVVWSLPGRDFVCLEPWSCAGDALNTGDRLIRLAAGETRRFWLEYRLV